MYFIAAGTRNKENKYESRLDLNFRFVGPYSESTVFVELNRVGLDKTQRIRYCSAVSELQSNDEESVFRMGPTKLQSSRQVRSCIANYDIGK